MKQLKKNAAAWLLAMFCAVFLVPTIFTACTNSEDGTPTFKASQKKIVVEIPKTDTIWYPVPGKTDTLYIEVIKKEGIKANGNPDLFQIDDLKYRTIYPLIEDGNPIEAETELNVWAKIADCDHDIIVLTDSIISAPSFSVTRNTRSYQDGDFTKMEFKAGWNYNFGTFTETLNTLHEIAWYKGWQMKSSFWLGGLKEVRYGKGVAYTHEGVVGKLFEHTLVWEFVYNEDDVRTFTKTHRFFVANTVIEPDPEATEIFGKNFDFKTTSDSTAITSFEVWQRLANGKTNMISNLSAGLKFWLVNAKGEVIDLSQNQEFLLSDLQAVAGSKQKVGEPRIVGSISIQEYVTTYTTKTDKSSSVFYGHTEEATLIIPEKLGGNIPFTAKDFIFADKGTSKLQDIADEGNFERKEAFTRIVAVYHDRSLNGQASIILRKVTDDPTPEKKPVSYEEKKWDGANSYVIRIFYDDKTYEDFMVEDPQDCIGSLEMKDGTRIERDNINFGKPTIDKDGKATAEGSSIKNGDITRQQMAQPMEASYSGYSHKFIYRYTKRTFAKYGLDPIELSVPMWISSHKASNDGTVRKEVENNKNYDVTPMTFVYSTAFGKTASDDKSHSFEVWKYISDVAQITGIVLKNFGFDYVNMTTSYAYATFYSELSDKTQKELGVDGVNVYNEIIMPNGQTIDTEDFNVSDAAPIPGTKTFVSSRDVACKFGGKFVVSKYSTLFTTKTNKASVVFTFTHEEVVYVPEQGAEQTDSKWHTGWEISDLGSTPLVDLGRKNGKDGKMYKSQINASYNGRSNGILTADVNLWVKSDNQHGIDIDWTNANAGAVHFWDPSNTHHISMTGVYNNKDGVGGIKGYSDGNLVIKATWDEVNKPTGRLSVAQDAGGTWYICQVSETTDKKGWIWRSIMKGSENKAIRSVQKTELQVYGSTEVYINTTAVENADGTVTLTATNGGSVTLGAW